MTKRHVVWDLDFRAWRDRRTGHYWVYHRYAKMWMVYARDEIEYLQRLVRIRIRAWEDFSDR